MLAMSPIISVHNLSKKYASGFEALKNVSLEILRGEIFALLGPNGAGKTTLINIICGIVNPSGGSVKADGFDIIKEYRAARSKIGLVPQEVATDIFSSVWDTVSFSRGLFGKPARPAYVEKVLKDLSLYDKKDSRIMTLSGGMKRRVLIAKALAHEPEILFLDEPTAGVDVELRRQLWDYVVGLNRRGVTILLTTHYLEEAEQLCDQIAIVNHGEVVACQPTAQLLTHLDTRAVVITPEQPLLSAPSLPPFETRLRPSGELAISFRTHEAGVEQVLAAARAAGVHIRDLRTEEPDLEDVFLALTYGADAARVGAP
jgi:ABC-2 type transport system ATP-binding protein